MERMDPALVEVPAEVAAVWQRKTIRVSTYKNPLCFYVNLAKRYMRDYNEVELTALGMAIGNVISVAENLKDNGYARQKGIRTSTIGVLNDNKNCIVRKPKIEIWLEKTENLK